MTRHSLWAAPRNSSRARPGSSSPSAALPLTSGQTFPQVLGLPPSSASPGSDGSDAVKRIPGAVATIATGLAELRNRGYGTGHGPAGARVGPRPRHAHLVMSAAP